MKVNLWDDQDGREVILSGDARNDSLGHCTQYCTNSLANMETKTILNVNIVDVIFQNCIHLDGDEITNLIFLFNLNHKYYITKRGK